MNNSREDKSEYLLKEERKGSESGTENHSTSEEKSNGKILYLKFFDPESNTYYMKPVLKPVKSISNSSSLNYLNK